MPSLDDILQDTLIRIGAASNPVGLSEFEPGVNGISPRPSPDTAIGSSPQPIWIWDYSGLRDINQAMPMNRVENLEVWSRSIANMHGVDQGWMSVAMQIAWGPVMLTLPHEKLELPLTQKYFGKGLMLSSGTNPGTNAWWPLPANLDQSFASAFLYDLTSRQPFNAPAPVDAAHFNSTSFMPQPDIESGELPVGSTGDTEDRHFICVVLSLVCMQERDDFEPGGIVGMGRLYPHFMIMSNKRLTDNTGMSATVTLSRPDRSGYHGTFANPGGTPRIMGHPDMDPEILPLLIAEPNVARGIDPLNLLPLPYWDLLFDYFLPVDYRGGVSGLLPRKALTRVIDRALTSRRTVKGALRHLDYSKLLNLATIAVANPLLFPQIPLQIRAMGAKAVQVALSRPSLQAVMFNNWLSILQLGKTRKADFLPRIGHDLIKLPGQGTFDNLHLAPRMVADKVIGQPPMNSPQWQSSLDTLDSLRMAPFCEHDCLHTHWRWGGAFKDNPGSPNQLPLRGFDHSAETRFAMTGRPYQSVGKPMVPLNQDIDISFNNNQTLVYTAHLIDLAPGVWQPVYHHGSAYVLGFSSLGKALHDTSKAAIGNSMEDAELYWNLRYQATTDGALERVEQDAYGLHRAMMASNSIRIHTKVLAEPEDIPIERMLANARALLDLHNIGLLEVSRETCTDSDITRFTTLVIDDDVPTDEQTTLFNYRGEAKADELVIYHVRTLVPAQAGCAVHPPEKPGAIIASAMATEWTLAHQIGHILGLDHVEDINHLMTRRRTDSLESTIPILAKDEVSKLLNSKYIGLD